MYCQKKSQTAVEYLIILAVVIIISLTVIGLFTDIPQNFTNSQSRTIDISQVTLPVGIDSFDISDYESVLSLRNNQPTTISIDSVVINGEECLFFYNEQYIIPASQTRTLQCQNVYEMAGRFVDWPVQITWTNMQTGAQQITSNDNLRLQGTSQTRYMNILIQNGFDGDGCWNYPADPTHICSCDDLARIGDNVSHNYVLKNIIDFDYCANELNQDYTSGAGWNPIVAEFAGTLDGQYTITGSLNPSIKGTVYNDEAILLIQNNEIAEFYEELVQYLFAYNRLMTT
ncbi:MAG: hypothetical protein ACMXYA_03175 [Candidatus Woesearchaeota archaeon]